MQAADLAQVLAWRNQPDVRRFMYSQHEITLTEHQRWFEQAILSTTKHLLIFEINGAPLGYINFTRQQSNDVANWGFYLSPDAPKGTGILLGRAAINFSYEQLKLHKVCGEVLAFNERSIRFHKKLGFMQEGILREQHFDGYKYHDVINFGLLVSEWQTNQTMNILKS